MDTALSLLDPALALLAAGALLGAGGIIGITLVMAAVNGAAALLGRCFRPKPQTAALSAEQADRIMQRFGLRPSVHQRPDGTTVRVYSTAEDGDEPRPAA